MYTFVVVFCVCCLGRTLSVTEEKVSPKDNYNWHFLDSQVSFCVERAVKPTKKDISGTGGFIHCKQSIGKCINKFLFRKHHETNKEVTGNISLTVVKVVAFSGTIDVYWHPPRERDTLFYMARVWNIVLQNGYNINVTVLVFNLAFTEECMLDHFSYERLFPGYRSGLTYDDNKLWGRLCGRRPPFYLYSYNSSAKVAVFVESYADVFIRYNTMITGNVRALSSAQITKNPYNRETKELLEGYYAKIFREDSYFWYFKGDIASLFEIRYTVRWTGSSTSFFLTIVDGPLLHDEMSTDAVLMQETYFEQKNDGRPLKGGVTSTGFMAVLAIHKLSNSKGKVPITIEYVERVPHGFSSYKTRKPFEGKQIVKVMSGRRAYIQQDISNYFGTWHFFLKSPQNKYISIVIAVQRQDTSEHRELGVESNDCLYSGFGAYNDSVLIHDKKSLGPFCGKWWTTDESWIKNMNNNKQTVDWSNAFITSAQNTINLIFYRYYDPYVKEGDVILHIYARTEECPGMLTGCDESNDSMSTVKVNKCVNIYLYVYRSALHECDISFIPSNEPFIRIKENRMTRVEDKKRVHFNTKTPSVRFLNCKQLITVDSDMPASQPKSNLKRFTTRTLNFTVKAKACTISRVFARFFLSETQCITDYISSTDGENIFKYSDYCGSIGLPEKVKPPSRIKFDLHNSMIDYYELIWRTNYCTWTRPPKFKVIVNDVQFSRVTTLEPKTTSRNDEKVLEWKTGGNNVIVSIYLYHTTGNCPLSFQFTGGKVTLHPAMNWNFSSDQCMFSSKDSIDRILLPPVTANMSWQEAERYCQKQGGHLLDIDSKSFLNQLLHSSKQDFCGPNFNSLYSSLLVFIGLHDLHKFKDYLWTSCGPATYSKWRNPNDEKAFVRDIKYQKSSFYKERILKDIWTNNGKQPSKNKTFRCVGMIMQNPNMEPTWVKIPCKYKFSNVSVVCSKSRFSKDTCSKENVNLNLGDRNRAVQWDKNVTCAAGWIIGKHSHQCFKLLTVLPKVDRTNSENYQLAMQACYKINGTVALISADDVSDINDLLWNVNYKESYGGIWLQSNETDCYALKPLKEEASGKLHWVIDVIPCNLYSKFNTYIILSVMCSRRSIIYSKVPIIDTYNCYDGSFVLKFHVCDGIPDCSDGSDESNCSLDLNNLKLSHYDEIMCSPLRYKCPGSGQCLAWSKVCDGRKDCFKTGDDETMCNKEPLSLMDFQCNNGKFISIFKKCDVSYDCTDGSDETSCGTYRDIECISQNCPDHEMLHVEINLAQSYNNMGGLISLGACGQLAHDLHPCGSIDEGCFKRSGICLYNKLPNGDSAYCLSGEHLVNCDNFQCPGRFKCRNSYCIPLQLVCDKAYHCPLRDDEMDCTRPYCINSLWCNGMCVGQENICDGINHCINGDDELLCDLQTCPIGCHCLGNAVECISSNLTVLPNITSEKLKALLLSQNKLSESSVKHLEFRSLHELLILDFSYNKIGNINPLIFSGKENLKYLYLQGNNFISVPEFCFLGVSHLLILQINLNPIVAIHSRAFFGLGLLTNLDLSRMLIESIGQRAFGEMTSLLYLNISCNKITYIGAQVFQDLVNLTYLNLSGNSLKLIDPASFRYLNKLFSLHTDDYKFCCAALHVNACLPEPDVYSSCDDLMSSNVLRVCIWMLGFFSLIGNMAVVCYRAQVEKPTALSFLVHNLGVADFMMGIYLLIIAGADAYYSGVYYLHDSFWRSHFVCRSAGVMSMLSSEMSVYVLVLITTDRVLIVGLGRNSLGDTLIRVLTISGWIVFILLSVLPVTNISYFGIDDYIKHGVCFLFNLTEGKVGGWEYATTIFIAFNLFALIYLAVGYSFIFVSVLCRTGFTGDMEAQLAKKLALVVLTDCICWIPPITVGILSLRGQSIHPKVAMWIAVFVFPINSSLNPFLYTFSTCSNNPAGKNYDSEDDNGVTQCHSEFQNDAESVSDDSGDYEHLGAVGGRLPKVAVPTVKTVHFSDDMLNPYFNDERISVSSKAGNDILIQEMVDNPILRANSADSGIEELGDASESSKNLFGNAAARDQIEDTAF